MNIVVCDDNKTFAETLVKKINILIPRSSNFGNIDFDCSYIYPAEKLLKYAENKRIDILFLDITMPDINGLEVAQRFYEDHSDTLIIFVTSYENYVFHSLKFNPFRFIRKNALKEELEEAVISALGKLLSADEYLTITNRNDCTRINIQRILYMEKEKDSNYINIVTVDDTYRHRANINELSEQFKGHMFVKINAGTIVNLRHISAVQEGELLMSDNQRLLAAKKYIRDIKERYIEFMRGTGTV
ncbi:MAG: response regulator transcription factor [Clostridia bacterium]|nr:response regulator transcription factor [Clostridia bacterium]